MAAGLLNANKRFGAPMYAPVLNNLAVIAVFWGFHRAYGTVGLDADKGQLAIIGLGTTVGVILMASAQIPFLRGLGRYRPTLSLRHPSVKKVARLSVFVVGFVVVSQLGFLIVQWLANAQRGGYTAYFAAYTFFLLPISLFSLSVTTALLPDMSSHAVNERWDEFRQRASVGVRATLFLVVPAAAGYVVLGHRILEALLRNGVVTSSSIDLVEGVLLLLALGMPQVAVFSLLVRTFYAMQDTRSPFLLACGGVLVTAAINIPLFAAMEVNGLALGHTIGNTLLVFIAARLLAARTSGLEGGRIWASTIRITIASALMGAAVWVLDRGLASVLGSTRTVVGLVIVGSEIAFGVAAYLGAAKLAGVEELTYLRRLWPLRATPSEVEVHGVVP
jgi:putative peptidoglycan lipid II flippase